jgi:hypothetical protein
VSLWLPSSARCRFADCNFYCHAECHYAEYRYVKNHNAECHYVECRYAEFHGTSELVWFVCVKLPIDKAAAVEAKHSNLLGRIVNFATKSFITLAQG